MKKWYSKLIMKKPGELISVTITTLLNKNNVTDFRIIDMNDNADMAQIIYYGEESYEIVSSHE